jgi:hypothetical protein
MKFQRLMECGGGDSWALSISFDSCSAELVRSHNDQQEMF